MPTAVPHGVGLDPAATNMALLVVLLPFVAFVLLAVVVPLRRRGQAAGAVSIAAIAVAFLAALFSWFVWKGDAHVQTWAWIPADEGPTATVGVLLDPLSNAMLVLVTLVSLLVQIYSLAYLRDERAPSLGRYYTYQSLFAFSMLGLVLSPSFIQMFVFWELVGLCSYLLIGYWYERPSAARAAVKAFWITKLGDLGFVIGIVMLWAATGTFEFHALFALAQEHALAIEGLGTIMLLIYLGAVGKSAQFPLHVWLPDAMEGPAPVSALIHAATMVTAGVFMVTRAQPLFVLVPDVLVLIGWVGAFTALLAATLACVESDIKRVLAYSTVSQLGYMMAAVGAGAPDAGFLHLLTHGLFKALLFLGAGAVIHAVGTNDIFRMGGLFRAMPQTGVVFIVGTLALAGLPPLAGFFSKEAVLAGVWDSGMTWPFLMLALTVLLTAFYMFRVVFLTFFGRVPATGHPHEPSWTMRGPLWVLAALTVLVGIRLAAGSVGGRHGPGWLAPLSVAAALGGIALAWAAYQRGAVDPGRLAATFPLSVIDVLARRRYGLDGLYAGLYRGFILGLSRLIGWIDRYLVDGVLNFVSASTLRGGDLLRRIQSGHAQDYVYGVAFGVLLLLVWSQWWAR
ncbi:MAG: NADH-quinone oxidoreductase subunit L [Candidatus Rokuibacteriota bacterium]|nr:MAG: NADH-quinone oxidoreductase subunit L [Candidatus Rokubacteria bacterium]